MSLSEALDILGSVTYRIVNVLMSTSLFGIPIGVYFVGGFIIRMVMKTVFNVESEYTYERISSQRKSKGE